MNIDAVVQVRTRREARCANAPDSFPRRHLVAAPDERGVEMEVRRHHALSMVDDDSASREDVLADIGDDSRRRSDDARVTCCRDVDACMTP